MKRMTVRAAINPEKMFSPSVRARAYVLYPCRILPCHQEPETTCSLDRVHLQRPGPALPPFSEHQHHRQHDQPVRIPVRVSRAIVHHPTLLIHRLSWQELLLRRDHHSLGYRLRLAPLPACLVLVCLLLDEAGPTWWD